MTFLNKVQSTFIKPINRRQHWVYWAKMNESMLPKPLEFNSQWIWYASAAGNGTISNWFLYAKCHETVWYSSAGIHLQ